MARRFWFESLQKSSVSSTVFLSFFMVYFLYLRIGHVAIFLIAAPTLKPWLNGIIIKLQKNKPLLTWLISLLHQTFVHKCRELTCKGRMRFRGSISVRPFCRSSARRPCRTLCCIGSCRSGGGQAADPPCSCSCYYTGPGPGDTYSGSWSSWATLLPAPNLQGKWTTHSPCYNCQNTKPYDRISTVWISDHTSLTQFCCTAVEVLQWRRVRKKGGYCGHTES